MNFFRPRNNKKEGFVEFFVYKEKKGFTGVCLTFGIVEEGNNPIQLMKNIQEAAQLHLEVVIKKNLSDDLLNRYAPEEYWNKYFEFLMYKELKRIDKPVRIEQLSYSPKVSLTV